MTTKVKLRARGSVPQVEFINAREQFPAFVAGFGSGKTKAGVLRAVRLKLKYPKQDVAYYLPTYDLVSMIGYPRFEEELRRAGLRYKLNESKHVITIPKKGRIIFRTMENPARIVGYEVADSVVDELDTLKEVDAEYAWRQIIARNRQKKPDGAANTVAVATTPEGFRFVYKRWKKSPAPGYRIIHASTYSNARNLPDGYINSLLQSYPAHLIKAYLDGLFVNLTSGAVYPDFDRDLNHADDVIVPGEDLHIGLDFNVYNCTAVVAVVHFGQPVVVAELTKMRDTPHVIETIREAFAGHRITIYPDASGQSNKTVNATESDVLLLQQAGFAVEVSPRNPLIRERVMAVNGLICNARGDRNLKINTTACPVLTECLEQQIYDANGQPDKSSGTDHAPDALGYFVNFNWPIVKPGGFVFG